MDEFIEGICVLGFVLGLIIIGVGFVIGAFMLHWILGIITLGFFLMIVAVILAPATNKERFWDDF